MRITALVPLVALIVANPLLPQQQQHPTFSITSNVVIVNVTVLDKNGKPIENLKKSDFQLFEDGKPQTLQAVDLQRLQLDRLPPMTPADSLPPVEDNRPKPFNTDQEKAAAKSSMLSRYQDRRLIVMLFDFSSMEPAEQIRSRDSAIKFLKTQMTKSDSVSIMVFGDELKTVLDFTADRDLLINTINKFRIGDSSENAAMADEGSDSQDTSGSFVADETEFNIFNSDLKLAALEDAARRLAQYPEKKALIYFSSGIQKSGVDNQSQLLATVNTAVRSNVAFYPIDARGLIAQVPSGDATTTGSGFGNAQFSGSAQRTQRDNLNNQQETLYTLAAETGGKALLDSNDLTEGMRQVQQDFTSYYVLSYVSTNQAQDGKYRRIQVKLAPADSTLKAKIEYRQGYYGPTTFAKMKGVDKDAQLQQALLSANPVMDLPLALEVDYFRLEKDKYFAPISVKIPGSALSFKNKGAKAATELDFIAEVFDTRNRPAASVQDTIPIKVTQTVAGVVEQKSIEYDTGVTLTPGKYRLRFVARENGEGKIGTFEEKFTIPDLDTGSNLRLSSVVFSNQQQSLSQQIAGAKNPKKLIENNPLVNDKGDKLVPNVTKVFHPGQDMFVYLEVYDPTIPDSLPERFRVADIEASLALYSHNKMVFETKPFNAHQLLLKRNGVLPVRIQLPVNEIKPGRYACQVNVIDEFGRKFAFPRTEVAVLPGAVPKPVVE